MYGNVWVAHTTITLEVWLQGAENYSTIKETLHSWVTQLNYSQLFSNNISEFVSPIYVLYM